MEGDVRITRIRVPDWYIDQIAAQARSSEPRTQHPDPTVTLLDLACLEWEEDIEKSWRPEDA